MRFLKKEKVVIASACIVALSLSVFDLVRLKAVSPFGIVRDEAYPLFWVEILFGGWFGAGIGWMINSFLGRESSRKAAPTIGLGGCLGASVATLLFMIVIRWLIP